MGYDVHITRKENWFDQGDPDISLAEWAAYVSGDPEMRLDGFAEADVGDGRMLRIESDGLSVWTAYSRHGEGGNMAWFDIREGTITVKNPDPEILVKMFAIAGSLGANVQGDEGERYGPDGNIVVDAPSEELTLPSRPWWRFW